VDGSSASLTGWFYTCAAAAAVCAATFVVAAVVAPRWPAMGAKYDAPGSGARPAATEQDMWRALDAGRDPTVYDEETNASSSM
jgi:hypothetical protein